MTTKHNIYNALLEEKIDHFIYSFKEASRELFFDEAKARLIHAGEFGRLREVVSKDFVRSSIPRRLDIGTGFIMNHIGEVSTQVDLVVYDRNETPLIQDSEKQYFYPVETVCAAGEIKSVLSKSDFKKAINKLARIKKIRERITEDENFNPEIIRSYPQRLLPARFDPEKNDSDRMFTFLICERFDFDLKNITNELNTLYESDIEPRNKHNLILSIDDGLLLYSFPEYTGPGNKTSPVPAVYNPMLQVQKSFFLGRYDKDPYQHFKIFCTYLFSRTKSISILSPDLAYYLGNCTEHLYQVEN